MNSTNITNQSTTTQREQTFEINNYLDFQYLTILNKIKEQGVTKMDRTGVGTKSIFGTQIRVNMKDGFPLVTSKKMFTKGVLIELFWLLGKHLTIDKYKHLGRNNIRYMVDNGVNIWVGDIYKKYKRNTEINPWQETLDQELFIERIKTDDKFAEEWGDLGRVYGQQWREWHVDNMEPVDQIDNAIRDLKSNPDSRRIMVNAWNVSDLDDMILPPCHYSFQFWTKELSLEERMWHAVELGHSLDLRDLDIPSDLEYYLNKYNIPNRVVSLMWNQRSADFPLGVPFNIASYAFLLHMVAKLVNMVPGELIGNFADSHIYLNQLDKIDEQSSNNTYELPQLEWNHKKQFNDITDFDLEDFHIVNYLNGGRVDYPLSN